MNPEQGFVQRDEPIIGYRKFYYSRDSRPYPFREPYRLESVYVIARSNENQGYYSGPFTWPIDKSAKAVCLKYFKHEGVEHTYYAPKDKPDHAAPYPNCTCGLYAYKHLGTILIAAPYYTGVTGIATVAVQAWGNVIIHGDEGWRAEYARPIAILESDNQDHSKVSELYQIPILSEQGIQVYAKEFGS